MKQIDLTEQLKDFRGLLFIEKILLLQDIKQDDIVVFQFHEPINVAQWDQFYNHLVNHIRQVGKRVHILFVNGTVTIEDKGRNLEMINTMLRSGMVTKDELLEFLESWPSK